MTESAAQANQDWTSRFFRDPRLPFIESRLVSDGRKVCYSRHSHATFSIGAILAGRSRYLNERRAGEAREGSVVIMNPGEVHACNPIRDQPWAYRMLYVSSEWLGSLQRERGGSLPGDGMHGYSAWLSDDGTLYRGLNRLHVALMDATVATLEKQTAAVAYFSGLDRTLRTGPKIPGGVAPHRLKRVAEYLSDNCHREVTLDELVDASGLSASHLIRSFKSEYGLTPHRYLLDRRLRIGRDLLRRGQAIAEVAVGIGFADQAHFQREFKRAYAMTPGHYRNAGATINSRRGSRRSAATARPGSD